MVSRARRVASSFMHGFLPAPLAVWRWQLPSPMPPVTAGTVPARLARACPRSGRLIRWAEPRSTTSPPNVWRAFGSRDVAGLSIAASCGFPASGSRGPFPVPGPHTTGRADRHPAVHEASASRWYSPVRLRKPMLASVALDRANCMFGVAALRHGPLRLQTALA